jgi:aldose 1-epimerase
MTKLATIWSLVTTLAFTCAFTCSCTSAPKAATATKPQPITIGGEPVVTLTRPQPTDKTKPQFLEATVVPGRGMNLLQVKAYLPGKGEIDLISTPGLSEAKQFLDVQDDEWGNNSFKTGAALLVPWANRIRGKLSADGKTIEAKVAGKTVSLPAGWAGKNPGAEKHAIHGLILKSQFQDIQQQNGPEESSVSGVLHAGNFGGRWLSQTDVNVQTVLKNDALEMTITTKNVGQEPLPMGIAFHPYFNFPSGDRKQAKLHLPADKRALVNNYDDVFPTGKIVPVKSTEYDFTPAGGKALGMLFMDDSFVNVKHDPDGKSVVEIVDPAANYGLRMTSLSAEVKAVQVYAPVDKNFIAVEPQFNFNDPYSKIWGKNDTGMVMLQPGQSVSWRVRLELFTPAGK